jgi:hypothetical protein
MHVTSNTNNINTADLHLDLTGETQVSLEFYWKHYANADHAENGIFFSDDAGATFELVHPLVPTSITANTWTKVSLDLTALATAEGLTLTNEFVVRFGQRGNRPINMPSLVNSAGFGFDSVAVFQTPPLTAGLIGGSDTLCFGTGGNVTITSEETPEFGTKPLTYDWQRSTNLTTWTSFGTSSTPDTTIPAPTQSVFIRRCVSDAGSQGPLCSNKIIIKVTEDKTPQIFGLAASYCNNNAAVTIYGSPTTPPELFQA